MFNENSNEFIGSLKISGHATVGCGCGRVHAAMLNKDFEESEKENMRRLVADDPKSFRIIHEDIEYVELAEIGGMQIVIGCDCMQLLELEKFLWQGRGAILKYYDLIQKKLERENISFKQNLETVSKSFVDENKNS